MVAGEWALFFLCTLGAQKLIFGQKNREIFNSDLFPSYLPKREVSSLQATLGIFDYLFLRGEHCLLWASGPPHPKLLSLANSH